MCNIARRLQVLYSEASNIAGLFYLPLGPFEKATSNAFSRYVVVLEDPAKQLSFGLTTIPDSSFKVLAESGILQNPGTQLARAHMDIY